MIKLNCKIISLILLSIAFSGLCSTLPDDSTFLPSEQASPSDPSEPTYTLTIPLANYHNQEYSGELLIGSEGKAFKLNFDTGFPWIWVSPDDANISSADVKPTLHCNFSSSCQIMTGPEAMIKEEIIYFPSSETIKGYLAFDNVAFQKEHSKVNQTLLLSKSTDSIQSEHYDGVCGLSVKNDKSYPSLLDTLHTAQLINKKVFGLYLSDNPEAYGEKSSEITFGGINPNYDKVDFVEVKVIPDAMYWQVSLDGIYLGTSNSFSAVTVQATTAIVASGISNIQMMSEDLTAFKNVLQTSYNIACKYNEKKDVVCPCLNGDIHRYPNITFKLDSKMLSIPPSLYLEVDENYCVLLLEGSLENSNQYFRQAPADSKAETGSNLQKGGLEKGTFLVLGGVFLRNYYTLFDAEEKKMSFTPAIRPPKSMITTLEVIYMIFGAFILVMFVVFVGCFIQICLTKKNPTMEKNGLDKTLMERKTTLSQFVQGLDSN
jgi:hypothetical protein